MLYREKKKKISVSSLTILNPVQYGTRAKYIHVVQMAIQDIHFFNSEFFLKQMRKTSCASQIFMNILLSSLTEFPVRQSTPSNDQNLISLFVVATKQISFIL